MPSFHRILLAASLATALVLLACAPAVEARSSGGRTYTGCEPVDGGLMPKIWVCYTLTLKRWDAELTLSYAHLGKTFISKTYDLDEKLENYLDKKAIKKTLSALMEQFLASLSVAVGLGPRLMAQIEAALFGLNTTLVVLILGAAVVVPFIPPPP